MTVFEHARLAVTAGDGVVARFPGIVCVARPAGHPAVPELIEHVAKAAGPNPGRTLARRLAGWLSGPDAPGDDLEFGTLSLAQDRIALFLLGDVSARVDGRVVASGGSSAAWADHLMPYPEAPVLLAPDQVTVPADAVAGVTDLRDGVVPGGGVAFAPTGARVSSAVPDVSASPAPTPSAPAPQAAPPAEAPAAPPPPPVTLVKAPVGAPVAPAQPAVAEPPAAPSQAPAAPERQPAPPADLSPPRRSEQLVGLPVDKREPLEAGAPVGSRRSAPPAAPVAPSAPSTPSTSDGAGSGGSTSGASASGAAAPAADPAPASAAPENPQTRGHLCSRGHLNDPRSHFCVLCGIRMNERTGVLVLGPRPPLGLLVFDNGATFTVDAEYLVGRTPETDQRVASGELRPLTVEDSEGAVSRVHAEVRVRGWDVVLVDSGSRNGTFVVPPGEQGWTPIASGKSHRLAPGTRVRLGEKRTFIFESPSGVR